MHHTDAGGVTVGHTASFTWDGEVRDLRPRARRRQRRATARRRSNPLQRTFFFLDVETGEIARPFLHPAAADERRELHDGTTSTSCRPTSRLRAGRRNYQSGSRCRLHRPANAKEIAYADPAPLVDPNPPVGIELGGDWSTYWYNGRIYESDITRGLIIWNLSDNAVAGARKLGHLNPQTQEFTID